MRVTSTSSIQAERGKKSVPIKWRDNEWSPRIVIRPATPRLAACGFQKRELPNALSIRCLRPPGLNLTARRLFIRSQRDMIIPVAHSRFYPGSSSDSSL